MPDRSLSGTAQLPIAKAPMMARATTRIGSAVDIMPVPRPWMMLVAAPVSEAAAMSFTGLYASEQ